MPFNSQEEAQKIISFIREVFADTNKTTAVIGLSGGIDSAVSFSLTLKALGPEHVRAYHLPSKTTNPQHLKDIQQLTSDLPAQAGFHIIPIGSIIQKSWRIINHPTREGIQELAPAAGPRLRESRTHNSDSEEVKKTRHTKTVDLPAGRQGTAKLIETRNTNRLRLANITARIRMMILFDQAKKHDALVIGTENKSESMLGYFTRFGDSASDLEPITHLFKTQVIQLAKYLNLPESIITKKAPSADLWPGQTDQTELGFSYAEADPILEQISLGKNPSGNLAQKVIAQVNRSGFKQQVPYTTKNLPL
jgi:NAD+ synthetase